MHDEDMKNDDKQHEEEQEADSEDDDDLEDEEDEQDGEEDVAVKQPCILVFDSLGGSRYITLTLHF